MDNDFNGKTSWREFFHLENDEWMIMETISNAQMQIAVCASLPNLYDGYTFTSFTTRAHTFDCLNDVGKKISISKLDTPYFI